MAKSAPFLLAVTAQIGGAPSSGQPAAEKAAAAARGPGSTPPPRLYRIQQDGRVGFIDRKGAVVIPPTLHPLTQDFSDGIVLTPAGDGMGYDLLDPAGKRTVLAPKFRDCSPFAEGLAMFGMQSGGRILCGFMGQQGREVIRPQFRLCEDFSEGLAAIAVNGKWGFLDRQGKLAIQPQYDFPEKAVRRVHGTLQFHGGLCRIPSGSKTGYIDSTGKWVWPPSE